MAEQQTNESRRRNGRVRDRLLAGGAGAGAGLMIALALSTREPKAVIDAVSHFGGAWALGLVALLVANQNFGKFMEMGAQMIQVQKDNTAAAQELANAVRQIAEKDDRERVEQRRLISFVGTQQEKILERLDGLAQHLGEKARGANA